MRFLFIVAFLDSQLMAFAVEATVLMQSRLRGSKTSISDEDPPVGTQSSVEVDALPALRFSDDDESCTTEGLSPGVCALSSLARPMVTSRLRKATDCDENESRERLERALLAEIEAGLSGNHSAFDFDRLHTLEEELRPLYSTLPHEMPLADIKGGLGFTAARYLLHQYFVRRHSWYVRGLNPAGDGRKPPDHKEALRSRVAGHLLELIEQKVGLQGLNLKTLAVVVATLEHLLHGDERQRLKQSWLVHDLKPEDLTDAQGLQSVVEVFMAHFVYSSQKSDSGYVLTLQKGREEVSFISRIYDGWTQISQTIRREVQKIQGKDFNFNDAVQVADQVLENFRTVSGSMCLDMSAMLAQMPGGPVGRVPLHEMRKKDLFRETLEYLRAANALDESEPEPIVLVPNYMLGPSNCDGTTSFYDLCCPDLCAGHRSAFEGAISDAQSVEFLQDLALEEGAAAASLPKLRELLDAEADLHGPEFSMWLHKTSPQHCPRPDLPALSSASASARAEFQATAQVGSLFEW